MFIDLKYLQALFIRAPRPQHRGRPTTCSVVVWGMAETYIIYIEESRRAGRYLISCPELFQDYLEIPEGAGVYETVETIMMTGLGSSEFNLMFFGKTDILSQ